MVEGKMTRRGFLTTAAGLLSFVALGFLGCGKKPEEKVKAPKKVPSPEMTQEEKEEYVFGACICKKCPSYVECGEKAGYCLVGKSTCITEKKGCICGDCPVTKKMGLKWGYYCTEGSAMAMMEAEKKEAIE